MKFRSTLEIMLLLHFISHIIHVGAHLYHGIPAVFFTDMVGKTAGYLFILAFFIILPLLGWWQLRKKKEPQCYYVLALTMLPAWAYAFIYHFILKTSDHVCLFGATVAGRWFVWSAYSISIVDAGIFILCFYAIVKNKLRIVSP